MVSRFVGRDYNTLRTEIIEFLRQRLPTEWDYTNLSDPVVIFAESLARVGDQLHYTIDELRRECDVATAKRASSIYSYAMREGYKMMLPKGAYGQLSINSSKEQSGCIHLSLKKFDEIKVKATGDTLYVADDAINDSVFAIDADLYAQLDKDYATSLSKYMDSSTGDIDEKKRNIYAAYVEDTYNKTQHVNVVLGSKETFSFTYSDINNDSTVDLPDPIIDRDLIRLTYTNNSETNQELTYVDDVISSGFDKKSFTLTPKFIGGAITLTIEFPTNYRDIFNQDKTTSFTFEYIKINDAKIDPTENNANSVDLSDYISIVNGQEENLDIIENGIQYVVSLGNGIKGYTEYEDANVTRENYKHFVQNYSALLTKDDYTNYIKATTSQHCQIFDHSDMYKNPPVVPDGTELIPRVIYILTDAPYDARRNLWYDLKERSSRSDCIFLVPYGKDPYTIVIKAECYLLGTSAATVATQIKSALLQYYAGSVGEKVPDTSMINYIVHKASDKVIRMDSLIVRDSEYGNIDTTFNNVNQLDNNKLDGLFNALKNGDINFSVTFKHENEPDEVAYYLKGTYQTQNPEWVNTDGLENDPDVNGNYRYSRRKVNPEWVDDGIGSDPDSQGHSKYEINPEWIETDGTDPDSQGHSKYLYEPMPVIEYNKYPIVQYLDEEDESINGYKKFPDSFPKMHYVINYQKYDEINTPLDDLIAAISANEPVLNEYDTVVEHQAVYGELDREEWDISDDKIFNEEPTAQDDSTAPKIRKIPYYYKLHHYMVPVLNNVVVLIKAVSR